MLCYMDEVSGDVKTIALAVSGEVDMKGIQSVYLRTKLMWP